MSKLSEVEFQSFAVGDRVELEGRAVPEDGGGAPATALSILAAYGGEPAELRWSFGGRIGAGEPVRLTAATTRCRLAGDGGSGTVHQHLWLAGEDGTAILTGDFVLARASEILADLGTDAVRLQAQTFGRLVQGQILETSGPPAGADPLQHYIQVIADKTASLIASSARFGATFADADPKVVETITRACDALGMAFQLSDDILDVASESAESGKTPGTDLREGVLTLPMFHALRGAEPEHARLRSLLGRPLDDAETEEGLRLLRAHPAMATARADLNGWADLARAELATLPDGPARYAFEVLCDYVVERTG